MDKYRGKKPKILLYDIETMANLAYVWGKYEQDTIAVERHWYMITYAWKWLDKKTTHVASLPDFPLYKKEPQNDIELVKSLWNLFNEADVIIAHNGNAFDIKKTNARFIKHGLKPPSLYKTIDTKLVAKKYFKFDSNKLDDLGDYFNIGRKINTGGWELWAGCQKGDPEAWKKMCKYNKQDVILLEKVYKAMLPYMENHPNYGMFTGERMTCPNCNSGHIVKDGVRPIGQQIFQRWMCIDCGARPRSALKDNSIIK